MIQTIYFTFRRKNVFWKIKKENLYFFCIFWFAVQTFYAFTKKKHYIEYLLVGLCGWCKITVKCLFSHIDTTLFVVLIVKRKKRLKKKVCVSNNLFCAHVCLQRGHMCVTLSYLCTHPFVELSPLLSSPSVLRSLTPSSVHHSVSQIQAEGSEFLVIF